MVTGDGGFMLGGLAEFNSAVRDGTDLIVMVCNDGAYGAEHIQFRARDLDASTSTFQWPDFAPVAEALGGQGYTVRNLKDLDGLADVIANRDRPLLIDVKLDPNVVPNFDH
jgi:thiamine pyrophosphate-dependent acetolactate synthase large subunit-like protein